MTVNLKRMVLLCVLVQFAVVASALRLDFRMSNYADSVDGKKVHTFYQEPIEVTIDKWPTISTAGSETYLNVKKDANIKISTYKGCRIRKITFYYYNTTAMNEVEADREGTYDNTGKSNGNTGWTASSDTVTSVTITNKAIYGTGSAAYVTIIRVLCYAPGPTLDPPGGKYAGTQTVTMSTPWVGTIHYTTDGSKPTRNSTEYNGPIEVSESMTINALVYDDNTKSFSDVTTAEYEIGESAATDVTMEEVVAGSVASGTEVMVTDTLVGVQLVQYGEKSLVVARDLHEEEVTIPEGMTDYMRELAKKQTTAWNRNRWLLLDLGKDIDERDIVGHKITGVTGILTDVTNPTIQLTAAPVSGDEITTSTNHYILANFNEAYQNGTGTVTAGSESHNFYFVTPTPCEIATIHWAQWNASTKTFTIPTGGHNNAYNLEGTLTVDNNYNTSNLSDGVYTFDALVLRAPATTSAPAVTSTTAQPTAAGPHRASATSSYNVYILGTLNSATSITDVTTSATPTELYLDLQGRTLRSPILPCLRITRHPDGHTTKTLLR